jgi:hypothetical protein
MNYLRIIRPSKIAAAALASIALISGVKASARGAQSEKPLPVVASASVPFYPRVAQLAHIEGTVQLRVVTDGTRASSIVVVSGPAMLAHSAEENIKTWVFEQHPPVTFEATFQYVLLASKCDPGCRCDDADHPTVELHLPSRVDVSAKTVMTCDPVERRH